MLLMYKSIDGFKLKLIAITAMLINHIGSGLSIFEQSSSLFFFTELIGKLTFPIMAYLLVEGFYYTHDRKKYAERLALFWIISIYPFHMLFDSDKPFRPIELVNNIFFTLLMGLLLLILYEKIKFLLFKILLVIFFSIVTMMSDWSLFGVLLIFGFYKWKNRKIGILFPILYTTFLMALMMGMAHSAMPQVVPLYQVVSVSGIFLAIPVLYAYNGQRGFSPRWAKWGFYCFYPLHLVILTLITNLI